ncbi:hypothetical protein QOV31_005076 (plasmid) [Agrobacterium fabrum]|jgi:hypothetical protein|nr:hypothetical protein QOV31_005076 [Agrobacterium fabrum]CAD0217173.1 hypothetical protein AGTUEHA105_LOCUS5102 [Agrobacterium tumefaciens]
MACASRVKKKAVRPAGEVDKAYSYDESTTSPFKNGLPDLGRPAKKNHTSPYAAFLAAEVLLTVVTARLVNLLFVAFS